MILNKEQSSLFFCYEYMMKITRRQLRKLISEAMDEISVPLRMRGQHNSRGYTSGVHEGEDDDEILKNEKQTQFSNQLNEDEEESTNFDDYIDKDMDFEDLNNNINLLLNATDNPNLQWKQVDNADTTMFFFMEDKSAGKDEDEDEVEWYIPWYNLKDAFKNAGIPDYYKMGLWERSRYKGVSYSTEVKVSKTEDGRKMPQFNIFTLWGR